MFYNLRHAGTALTKLGVMDFATTIAPGLRDVLLTGKAAEAVRRKAAGKTGGRVYDAVVMDAPPTGRIGRFLNVTSEVSGLARVGPIRGHADTVQRVIRSPETAVHFVTVLEEMPVQETLDGIAELTGLAGGPIPIGGIMINMTRPLALPADQVKAAARRPARHRRAGRRPQDGRPARQPPTGRRAGRGACRARQDHRRARSSSASGWTRRASPATSCRGSATGWTWAGCTGWPPRCGTRGPRDESRRPGARRARARRGPADRRPAHPHHRLLRLRRRRQDHHRRRRRAARRRARPARGGADRRPGPPARPVDGPDLAGQHPSAGTGRRPAAPRPRRTGNGGRPAAACTP